MQRSPVNDMLEQTLIENNFYSKKYEPFVFSIPERAKLKLKIPMEPVYIDVNNNMWRWIDGKYWMWEGCVYIEPCDNL